MGTIPPRRWLYWRLVNRNPNRLLVTSFNTRFLNSLPSGRVFERISVSKLNRSTRFLVMNRLNEVVFPKDEEIPGYLARDLKARGEISKMISPSFKNEGTAKGFGGALAAKYPGERFYLAKVIAGCVVEPATGPWVATGAALADDNTAEDLDGDLDGADDNE